MSESASASGRDDAHVSIRGLNGAQAVAFERSVKHGAGKRRVEIQVEPETILRLADALRCCPKNREGTSWFPAHAVWHYERPDRGPCGGDR